MRTRLAALRVSSIHMSLRLLPDVAQLATPAHRLLPAEDLFHPFAHFLAHCVPGMARGPLVDRAASAGRCVLGDSWTSPRGPGHKRIRARENALHPFFKLVTRLTTNWRAINGPNQLLFLITGDRFVDGNLQRQPPTEGVAA